MLKIELAFITSISLALKMYLALKHQHKQCSPILQLFLICLLLPFPSNTGPHLILQYRKSMHSMMRFGQWVPPHCRSSYHSWWCGCLRWIILSYTVMLTMQLQQLQKLLLLVQITSLLILPENNLIPKSQQLQYWLKLTMFQLTLWNCSLCVQIPGGSYATLPYLTQRWHGW